MDDFQGNLANWNHIEVENMRGRYIVFFLNPFAPMFIIERC